MGGADQEARVPPPSQVIGAPGTELSNPFYDAGPNDKGIGIQLGYSIGPGADRLLPGRAGRDPARLRDRHVAADVQGARSLHPGAAADLAAGLDAAGAVHIKDSNISADLRDLHLLDLADADQHRLRRRLVRRTGSTSPARWRCRRCAPPSQVILPAAAPTILTGMRISIGIAWLVIVAAEMLVGGTGIGYFVWNEWNNLSLTNVIFSILMIGVVGMLLDTPVARRPRWSPTRNEPNMTQHFLEIEGLPSAFPAQGASPTDRVRERQLRHRQGRVRLHHRPLRLRQVDHPERARRARRADRRQRDHGRRRSPGPAWTAAWCSRTTRCCPG
jgi:nitrate/nitrite transport system permease protein